MVKLSCSWRSFNKFNIWAWILTSRAEVGSSQTKSLGCVANALAIDILCLWPPENSWGYRSADFWISSTDSNKSET